MTDMFKKEKLILFIASILLYSLVFQLYSISFSIYGCLAILGIHLFLVGYAYKRIQLNPIQYKRIIIVGIIFFVLAKIVYNWTLERDFPVIYKSPERFVINFFLTLWSSTPILWSILTFFKSRNK